MNAQMCRLLTNLGAAMTCSSAAFGQSAIYSNGSSSPADPAIMTSPGLSELQAIGTSEANAVLGFAMSGDGESSYRVADDFVVPEGQAWRITGVAVPIYGIPTLDNGIQWLSMRFWRGLPGATESNLMYADEAGAPALTLVNVANRISSTVQIAGAPAPTPPDQSRRIDVPHDGLVTPLTLTPGTYWLDLAAVSSGNPQIFAVPVTLPGLRGKPGANAIQWRLAPPPSLTNEWLPIIDNGKPASAPDVPQDLAFTLWGEVLPAPCGLADVAGGGQSIGPDGDLTADDIIVFIGWFFAGDARADVAQGGQIPGQDGDRTADDIVVFINAFFGGC